MEYVDVAEKKVFRNCYQSEAPQFFWALMENHKTINITSLEFTCREDLAREARLYFNGKAGEARSPKLKVDENVMSLGILLFGNNTKERLVNACRILNIIEEEYDWKKTKIYMVNKSSYSKPLSISGKSFKDVDNINVAYFRGSRRWLKSSHMISLFCLILRAGLRPKYNRLKSLDTIKAAAKRGSSGNSDDRWLTQAFNNIDILLGQYNKMFSGMTKKYLYNEENIQGSAYTEGINKLCAYSSGDKRLVKRLRKLYDEYKLNRLAMRNA